MYEEMERIADGDEDNGDRLIEDLEKQMMEQAIKESTADVAQVNNAIPVAAAVDVVKDENKMLDDLLDDLIKDEGEY